MSKKRDSFKKKRVVPGLSFRGRYFKKEPAKSDRVKRNDPCPCGSGKKYKSCCLRGSRGYWWRLKKWFKGRED
mgnify:CR=1 FL=1